MLGHKWYRRNKTYYTKVENEAERNTDIWDKIACIGITKNSTHFTRNNGPLNCAHMRESHA